MKIFDFITSLFLLPLLLFIDVWKSKRGAANKIGYTLLVLLFFTNIWISGYRNLFDASGYGLYELGLVDKLTNVTISGTSMMPTIKDREKVTLHSPKKYKVERGDIVSFKNLETGNVHYIKRVIGLENEQISLINGIVTINGKAINEAYIFQKSPTYGNTFLTDCHSYTIPKDHVAVLGDNRIVSSDSRVIGFIKITDIDGVIKSKKEIPFKEPDNTFNSNQNTINAESLLSQLNEKRENNKSEPLHLNPLLSQVAQQRAETIAGNYDTWKQKNPPITDVLDKRGYKYLLVQEFTTFGFLNEQQIVDQIMESAGYKEDFLSNQYYELGVGTMPFQKNQCNVSATVLLISWPTKPSYDQDTVSSWEKEIEILSETTTVLQSLKNNRTINQSTTQELLTEATALLATANKLSELVRSNEWLTDDDSKMFDNYDKRMNAFFEKFAAYLQLNEPNITDPKIRTAIEAIFPGNEEFNKKADETRLFFGQGKYANQLSSAIALLKLAQTDQEKAIAYYWRGLAEYKLKGVSAEQTLLKATELDKTYAAPYVTLSAMSMDEQNYTQALTYAQKCVQLDPEYAWCHNNLGLSYLYLNQKQKGIAELEKAVSLDSSNFTFNDNLKRAKSQ